MNDGMEQEQRLTQVRGAAAVGSISVLFFSSPFLSFPSFQFISVLSLNFHMSAAMKGSGGGAPPSIRLARRPRGY
jgi:hypothetical protein